MYWPGILRILNHNPKNRSLNLKVPRRRKSILSAVADPSPPSLVLQPPVGRPALWRPVDGPRCSRYPAQQRLNCLNWPNHKFLQIIRSRLGGTLWAAVNLSRACRVPHKISAPPPPVLLNSIIITTYYPHRRRNGSIPSPIPNIRMITSQEW